MKERLHIISLAGQDAVLAFADRSERIQTTPLFDRFRRDALRIRPRLITLDTAADVFVGNENSRAQTRAFINILRGLAIQTGDAAVALASHPSLTGISTGSGLSGNTAWHNSVRARMYLKAFSESENDDSALRVLECKKSNYGPISERIVLRWRNGVFVPEPSTGSLEKAAADRDVEDISAGAKIPQ